MSFLKKKAPLLLGMMVAFYAVAEFYIAHHKVKDFTTDLQNWATILTSAAYVLGAVNVIQFNMPKIRRRERDWQLKVVLLVAAAMMFSVGMINLVLKAEPSGQIAIATTADPAAQAAGNAVVAFEVEDDVMVAAGGQAPRPGVVGGKPTRIEVKPGVPTTFRVYRRVAGYTEFNDETWLKPKTAAHAATVAEAQRRRAKAAGPARTAIDAEIAALEAKAPTAPVLAAGDVLTIRSSPELTWGKEGRVFTWLYDHVFAPCNATMFALLAFFVASAAFRAFRARNIEAGLLLGGAILVMLGRVPIGAAISDDLPSIAQWILDIPNNGSRRAIMMGAAIGAIATGLRILLGLERSHLGSDE